jgi:hypothetical protein
MGKFAWNGREKTIPAGDLTLQFDFAKERRF